MDIQNYYLDIKKLNMLASDERNQIHSYYLDMLNKFELGSIEVANSIMLTLIKSGYLVKSCDDNMEKING